MTKSDKIQKLSELWGSCLVGHHKNRDCNHVIETQFSLGSIKYYVAHYGYLCSQYIKTFNTLTAAQDCLIDKLKEQITDECDNQIERHKNPSSWEASEINKDIKYWDNILLELQKIIDLKIDDIPPTIDEEEYLKTKEKYQNLKYDYDLSTAVLDKEKIPSFDEKDKEMKYSLNYRIGLLVKKYNK
jgi:hypothetical protein